MAIIVFISKYASRLPQQARGPRPKTSWGPAAPLKSTSSSNTPSPLVLRTSQRCGSKSVRSRVSSQVALSLAAWEVRLRFESSTGMDGDKKPGPLDTKKTCVPFLIGQSSIVVSHNASRVTVTALMRSVSSMTASK